MIITFWLVPCSRTVIPVQKKSERMKDKLTTHCSSMTTYRMYKDSEWELRFPFAASVSYQNGDRGKHGEVVRGHVGVRSASPRPRASDRQQHHSSEISFNNRSHHCLCFIQTDVSIYSATAPRLNGLPRLNSTSDCSIGKYRRYVLTDR